MGIAAQLTSAISRRGPRAAILVVGIVAIGVWGNLLGYSPLLVPASDAASSQMVSAFYTLGRLAVALLFIAAAPALQRRAGAVGFAFGVAMTPATLLICLSSATQGASVGSSLLSPSVLLPANALLAGMGFLAVSVPLFIELARLIDPRRAAALAMVGIVGECLVTSLLNAFASVDGQLLACLVCPMLAGACLFVCARNANAGVATDDGDGAKAVPAGRRTRTTGTLAAFGQHDNLGSVLMIAQLAFAMVLASTLRSLSDMGPWGLLRLGYLGSTSLTGFSLAVTCTVVVGATLAVYVLPRNAPSQIRNAVALVLVFCGLQIATAQLDGMPEGVVAGAVMGSQLFSRVIIWVAFMECVRQLRMQPLRVNGITCLFNVAGVLACEAVQAAGAAPVTLATGLIAVLFCVTLVAIALPFAARSSLAASAAVAPDGNGGSSEQGRLTRFAGAYGGPGRATACKGRSVASGNAPANPFASSNSSRKGKDSANDSAPATFELHEFAVAYELSPRQEQVLGLLLDGCTRGQIERLLGLSEGTIRTHVNAVYHKLNVHSKADAHALYDEWASTQEEA